MIRESTRNRPDFSVVIPLFNEEENLLELSRRVIRSAEQLQVEYEVIFVNDGSKDATPEMLDVLQNQNSRLVILHLSRNFGHQAAVSAGLDASTGAAVILMDGDLQDPPELFPQLLDRWREGLDVVYAVRKSRQESLWRRTGYWLFYRLLRGISELDIPLDSGDFCLLDRRVVDVLCHLPEKQRFVRGLRTFVGFEQGGIDYDRPARVAGVSKYPFKALVRLALDGLFNFSTLPLKWITLAGIASMGMALGLAVWLCIEAGSQGLQPSVAVALSTLLILAAGQFLGQGILGEYIRRIFVESKGRPTYVIGRRNPESATPSNRFPPSSRQKPVYHSDTKARS